MVRPSSFSSDLSLTSARQVLYLVDLLCQLLLLPHDDDVPNQCLSSQEGTSVSPPAPFAGSKILKPPSELLSLFDCLAQPSTSDGSEVTVVHLYQKASPTISEIKFDMTRSKTKKRVIKVDKIHKRSNE